MGGLFSPLKRFLGKGIGSCFAKRRRRTVHDNFDLAKWVKLFALSGLRKEARKEVLNEQRWYPDRYENQEAIEKAVALRCPDGEIVTSSYHIAVVEQLRREAFSTHPELKTVSTDVIVWGFGGCGNRDVTGVGGLPCWPARRPWPASKEGRPMDFVAQINFGDSRDLVGDTPGDILLMFAGGKCYSDWTPGDEGAVAFHWANVTDRPFIKSGKVPESRCYIHPCYGVIHRTVDYTEDSAREAIEQNYRHPARLCTIEGTKIGGIPHWIKDQERLSGRFLCSIGSIQPVRGQPFPFVNLEHMIPRLRSLPPSQHLQWGDMGSVYVFLDDKGEVHWTVQCY